MPKLLGFQVADHMGENIQGDENDPSGLPSFRILNAAEAWDLMAKFGKSHSLLLQPIFEGDVEEPAFANAPTGSFAWLADDSCVQNCDPAALATIAIRSGASDAPYLNRDIDNHNWKPGEDLVLFWQRVADNADRIAGWILSGLSISQRAVSQAETRSEIKCDDAP